MKGEWANFWMNYSKIQVLASTYLVVKKLLSLLFKKKFKTLHYTPIHLYIRVQLLNIIRFIFLDIESAHEASGIASVDGNVYSFSQKAPASLVPWFCN